ncbi:MAG: creatininase family protein [Candidatus Zixiibacteriota bacterium]
MAWHKLEEMIWQEVQEVVPEKCDLVFLPVGTIEAHGSAAIGTDNIIPLSISEYLAERFNAIMAPCVNYGITRSLYGYAGSLTIRPVIFTGYILDILHSLSDKKFKRCVIVNGHGGNNNALKDAAYQAYQDYGIKVAVVHWWQLCADVTQEVYGGPGGHAGIDETGFVMGINSKYGNQARYDKKMAYISSNGADVYPIPGSVLLYDKDGRGEPDFDPEKGKLYAEKVKKKMGDFLEEVFVRWDKFFKQ